MLTTELNRAIDAQREALAFAQAEAATTARELAHSPHDQVVLQRSARARDGAEEARRALELLESARAEAKRADADDAVRSRREQRARQGKAWVNAVADEGKALAQAVDKATEALESALEALKAHEAHGNDIRSGYMALTDYDSRMRNRKHEAFHTLARPLDDSPAANDLLRRIARALGYGWPVMPIGRVTGHTFVGDQAHAEKVSVRLVKEIEADHATD